MRRLAFGVALLIVIAGCPKSSDPPRPSPTTVPSASQTPARASAHPLVAGQALGGPNATGRVGDWILENDEVVFVVDGLGGGGGFAESGGNVIDAADARTRKDELGQVFTYFGVFPRQAVYSIIDGRSDADGSGVVVARGKELYDASLDVVTEYRLRPGARALAMKTTVTNTSSRAVTLPGLGDAIQWGGLEKFAPSMKPGFKGASRGDFVGGVGRFSSVAIARRDDVIGAISGGAWTDTEQAKDVAIAAGASVTYERALLVGRRGDSASIAAELARLRGKPLGSVAFDLSAPVSARLSVRDKASTWTIAPNVAGSKSATAELPVGHYEVEADRAPVVIDVEAGRVATAQLAIRAARTTKLGPCTEGTRAIPCKVTVQGVAPAVDPDFGPAHVAGPAKNQITMIAGESVSIPLPEGRYVVTASRGPEYELDRKEIAAGADASFALRRVVATPGWVACDFHQHSVLSADSAVAMRDRVIANAAEAVEVAVATEHNVVADLSPIVKELGLASFLVALAGDELTSDASKKPWGHANVFPLPVRDDRPRGGAVPVRDRSPSAVFADVRALPGGPRVVSINHPRTKTNGYFDLLGFDAKTGTSADPRYDASYEAIEIWSGRHISARDEVMIDWLSLLRNAHPVTPLATTDTHGIVGQEAGYPRTYVRVSKDDALEAWGDDRTQEIVRALRETHEVVLTNGPFVTVTANGVGIGGVARARAPLGAVDVNVRVVTASWNAVDRAELRRVGVAQAIDLPLSAPRTEGGATVRESSIKITARADDAFVVVVNGSSPMHPVLAGDSDETRPSAVTGPIWIDADGDGKSLGR